MVAADLQQRRFAQWWPRIHGGEGVGLALLVVLETLRPPERLAYVLHDLLVPFDSLAPCLTARLGRRVSSPAAPAAASAVRPW